MGHGLPEADSRHLWLNPLTSRKCIGVASTAVGQGTRYHQTFRLTVATRDNWDSSTCGAIDLTRIEIVMSVQFASFEAEADGSVLPILRGTPQAAAVHLLTKAKLFFETLLS